MPAGAAGKTHVAWTISGGIAGITAGLTVHADHSARADVNGQRARFRGRTVTVETGGDPPRRLARVLRHLSRLHDRHAPAR